MTTCPEVGLAKELAIPYASIAIVTDYDCWRENVGDHEHVGVEGVLAMFRANIEKVTDLILSVIPKIAENDWKPVWEANQKLVCSSIL
jgi:5'-methylthioadenosine phosphorylase